MSSNLIDSRLSMESMEFYLIRSHPYRAKEVKAISKSMLKKLVFGVDLRQIRTVATLSKKTLWLRTTYTLPDGRLIAAGISDTGESAIFDRKRDIFENGPSLIADQEYICMLAWNDILLGFGCSGCSVVTPEGQWISNMFIKRLYCKETCSNHSRDAIVLSTGVIFFVDYEYRLVKVSIKKIIAEKQIEPKINIVADKIKTMSRVGETRRVVVITRSDQVALISLADNSLLAVSPSLLTEEDHLKINLTTVYATLRFVVVAGVKTSHRSETEVHLYLLSPGLRFKSKLTLSVKSSKSEFEYSLNPVHSMLEVKSSGIHVLVLAYYYETVQVCLPRKSRLWLLASTELTSRLPNCNRIISLSATDRCNGELLAIDLENRAVKFKVHIKL